jgi:hypothetical protein
MPDCPADLELAGAATPFSEWPSEPSEFGSGASLQRVGKFIQRTEGSRMDFKYTVRIGLSKIRAGSLDVNSIRGRRTSHGRYDPTEHSLRSRRKYRKGSGEAAIYWPAARKPEAHRRGHESYADGLNVEKAASHPRVMS